MEPLNKIWQVEIDGTIEEAADLETLKDWLESGKVCAATRVRRDSLRWIELSEVKILNQYLQAGTRKPRREKTQSAKPRSTPPIPKKIPTPKPPFVASSSIQPPPEKKTSFKIHLLIMAVAASVISAGYVFYVNSKEWNPVKYALSDPKENTSLTMPEDYVEPSAIAKYKKNENLVEVYNDPKEKTNLINAFIGKTDHLSRCPNPYSSKPGYNPSGEVTVSFYDTKCHEDEETLKKLTKEAEEKYAAKKIKLASEKIRLSREIKIEAAINFAKCFALLFLAFLVLNFIGSAFATRRQYAVTHP